MTSEPAEVFVWAWAPGAARPVVTGRVAPEGKRYDFAYGRSYLERADTSISIHWRKPARGGVGRKRGASYQSDLER